jgi:putative ABC transport system permease protein
MKLYLFRIAIRNAGRNGTLSFAKLFGLSISFAVILFVSVFVYYETSFDKCIPGHDRIYRCLMEGKLNNREESFAVTSPEEAGAIVSEIPEITDAVRIMFQGEANLKVEEKNIESGSFYLADSGFFSFFGIPVTTNLDNPLEAPNYLVIAKSLAEKHFGSVEEAIDKTVLFRGDKCIITGVFNDLPKNFHLQPKVLQSLQKSNPDKVGWDSQSYYTYFKTGKPVTNMNDLNFKLTKTVYTHHNPGNLIDVARAQTLEDFRYQPELYIYYTAEPLSAIHFSKHKFDFSVTSNRYYVYGAVVLAFLILLISSVNFVNLSLAGISMRYKDIGIRKTTGAKNKHIIKQFLFESTIFLVTGFVLAVFIYQLVEMPLIRYLNLDITLSGMSRLENALLVFTGLLSFYLAVIALPVILISNKEITGLIKEERPAIGRFSARNFFILFQFILSVFIILSSLTVHKQIKFMVKKDRGYDQQNVMMLTLWEMHPEKRKSFIEELKKYPEIKSVATSDGYFGDDLGTSAAYFESIEETNYFHTTVLPVDDAFQETFGFTMKEGRFFDKAKKTDFDAAILNESAMALYPGNGSMVNKDVFIAGRKYNVIGIVKDFNYRSLHYPIQPLVMTRIENFGVVYVKINNGEIPEVIKIMQKLWKKHSIPIPFQYKFHDEVVAAHYIKDRQATRLLLILSILSIAIACVGLFAISLFTITRRTKEIGIRKVNGAQVTEVMAMLNSDFIRWVTIAFIIACPVAWYVLHKWLQNFAYKTALSWWIFAVAGAFTIVIALLTVSWQSWRAATRNPVEALRYE